MQRKRHWSLVRLAAVPRLVPAGLLGAWMVATAADAQNPVGGAVVGVVAAATVVVADRAPAVPMVAAFVGLVVADEIGGVARDDPWLTLIVCACFCVGRFGSRRHQVVAGVAVALLVAMNVADRGAATDVGDVAFPLLFTAGPWLAGLALQSALRRATAATDLAAEVVASSEAAVDRATVEERLRIARELHDVVAHTISALSLQAQTARRRTETGDAVAVEELRAIERSAQDAMRDLRGMLGLLRPTAGLAVAGPHEGLGQLPELLATAERVGQRVTTTVAGAPGEPAPALSLAAYRIVQEALANARKHAPDAPVSLRLEWSDTTLGIEVRNPGAPVHASPTGHGLPGMAERARLFGGTAEAGADGDDWVVRASLPLPQLQRAAT